MSVHKESLQSYYSALALIDDHYQDLQKSRTELLWYESKLSEAERLAVQHGLNTSSTNPGTTVQGLNRYHFLQTFSNFNETLNQYHTFHEYLQYELVSIQEQYDAELQRLRTHQQTLEEQLKRCIKTLDASKMAAFFYMLTIILAGLGVFYFTKNIQSSGLTIGGISILSLFLPVFCQRSLLTAISGIRQESPRHKKLHHDVREFRYQKLEEEASALTHKQSKENQLRATLAQQAQQARNELAILHEYIAYARRDVTEIKPQVLRDVWMRQKNFFAELIGELGMSAWDWTYPQWNNDYVTPDAGQSPSLFRFGELLIDREQKDASIPAIFTLRTNAPTDREQFSGHVVMFSNNTASRQAVLQVIESLAVRTIASLPAKSLKGIFIDPVNAGNTFPFKNFPKEVSAQQTYTRTEDIRQQLRLLAQHVEQMTQSYLSRDYSMIEEYNADSESISEAYRYVFIADFPFAFDHAAIEDLRNILLNGARAGVYVVMHVDDSLEKPQEFRYDFFDDYSTVIRPAAGTTTGGSFLSKGTFKVGYVYLGRVTRILHSGAYVEFLPGREGMLPTGNMKEYRIQQPEQAVSVGQAVVVKVSSIDSQEHATLTCLGIQRDEAISVSCLALQGQNLQPDGTPLFSLQIPSGQTFRLCLDSPPNGAHFNQLAQKVSEAIRNLPVEILPFERFYPQQIWTHRSSRNICVPIGSAGARENLNFLLGMYEDGSYEPAHALLAGTTGSGKSYTLHAIICSLALYYSPDELEMYLLDYKEGVEFQVYVTPDLGDATNSLNNPDPRQILPHARVISLESDAEFGLSVLENAIAQIEARSILFKQHGTANLESYREVTGNTLPRILVAIDEYQQMYLQADGRLCERLNDALEIITKQGRSFGVHLLLASQSPRVKDFRERIYEQIAVRMAMKMSKSTASLLMADDNVNVVGLLDRVGKIAYNDQLGDKHSNQLGQIAYIDSKSRLAVMKAVLQESDRRQFERSIPTVVFNGIRPAQLFNNHEINELSREPEWLSLSELNKICLRERDWIPQEKPCATWIGESMRLESQVRPIFRRRSRNNLLLIGNDESEVFGALSGLLVGLLHTNTPDNLGFLVADLSVSSDTPSSDFMLKFRETCAVQYEVHIGKRYASPSDCIVRADSIWQNVVSEFEYRKECRQEEPDCVDFGKSLFFVLALGSLSQMAEFRPVSGRIGEEMSPDAKQLMEILSQGPELGIHIVLWLSDIKSFHQLFSGNRTALPHFDMRVAFKMNDRDSTDLLGEGIAKKLRTSQAYFLNASTPEPPEKFRPYAIPSMELMEKYAHNFNKRIPALDSLLVTVS
jgi:DNA segregation ATPase FtsK/SpoIIIE, S-DNA-T family